jgi:hypothetical protein
MGRNHAIIEVKSQAADRDGVQKGLNTLSLVRSYVRYQRAIYLIYGGERLDSVVTLIERCATERGVILPIEVWIHPWRRPACRKDSRPGSVRRLRTTRSRCRSVCLTAKVCTVIERDVNAASLRA